MRNQIFVHKETLEEYFYSSKKDNRIRSFYSEIFKGMTSTVGKMAKSTFVDLEYDEEAQKGYTGVKAYRFKPRNCSNELKLFFSEFTVFVEVVSPEWLQKKKEWQQSNLHNLYRNTLFNK